MLDFEKMDVFRVAVEFRTEIESVLARVKSRAMRDQLERASSSVVANIAEGAGRRAPADKASFYTIARGSSTECVGLLAIAKASGAITAARYDQLHALIERVVMMLNKLIRIHAGRASSASG